MPKSLGFPKKPDHPYLTHGLRPLYFYPGVEYFYNSVLDPQYGSYGRLDNSCDILHIYDTIAPAIAENARGMGGDENLTMSV